MLLRRADRRRTSVSISGSVHRTTKYHTVSFVWDMRHQCFLERGWRRNLRWNRRHFSLRVTFPTSQGPFCGEVSCRDYFTIPAAFPGCQHLTSLSTYRPLPAAEPLTYTHTVLPLIHPTSHQLTLEFSTPQPNSPVSNTIIQLPPISTYSRQWPRLVSLHLPPPVPVPLHHLLPLPVGAAEEDEVSSS